MVIIETTLGDITLELDHERTPATAENFAQYVKDGFYDGLIFHRVIKGFMVQTGGLDKDMKEQKTRDSIANEADQGGSNQRGTIAMARTPDPDSASAQFFINLIDNKFLDHREKTMDGWGYCVFGKVISGMEIVDKIAEASTGNRSGHQDVPLKDIVIKRAYLESDDD